MRRDSWINIEMNFFVGVVLEDAIKDDLMLVEDIVQHVTLLRRQVRAFVTDGADIMAIIGGFLNGCESVVFGGVEGIDGFGVKLKGQAGCVIGRAWIDAHGDDTLITFKEIFVEIEDDLEMAECVTTEDDVVTTRCDENTGFKIVKMNFG